MLMFMHYLFFLLQKYVFIGEVLSTVLAFLVIYLNRHPKPSIRLLGALNLLS